MNNDSIAQRRLKLQDGIEIFYYDSIDNDDTDLEQDSNKAILVLLHGFCGSSAYWEKVVPQLEQHARVIVPDLRGQGRSSASSEEVYPMEMYADDLAEMLEQLNINGICLLGHSLGGYIALSFAERHKDKLKAFGLIHSTPLADSEAAKENRDNMIASVTNNGLSTFIDGLIPKLYASRNRAIMSEQMDWTKRIGYTTSVTGAIGAARGMKERPDRTSVLKQIDLPVLLLAGVDDEIIPVERTLIIDGPHVTSVKLENAGHMGMIEQPEAFAHAVISFMDALNQ